ncbi:SusC/RagA family TonB-linked outer membrane protein [Neotamlana laminarinivorans]|uniref:TonB-dependent receptor n=1 Tax=Neotamlana laminarinivorans TaxID=2883124 RepID=A0A9X1HYJ7_9FLAO|nr:TonB-dependent receptor [Tamlana laminarinivorans]MCB4797946.1 TonB-dependent receptor [Tamlana laminarinivorans]
MKKTTLTLVLLFATITYCFSQVTVSGNVISNIDNMPIPGASVVEKGTPLNGVATDFDGNFTITLNNSDGVLVISSIGYATTEVSYSGNQNLKISLTEEISALNEVLLIGYGSSKKGDIVTSISQVNAIEDITTRPVSNFSDFLQGNVAGVTVLQQGGDPSESANIVVRGLGSISDETALTVVDGVPYYGPAINPNDIESVSILKDAAAAAIYGAQAASGVIVISTKKGAKGKPKVNLDFYGGLQTATNLPSALNAEQQANIYNLAADNGGTQRLSAHDASLNPWGQVTRTDWIDEIFRTAATYNLNANVSGGSEHSNYMTSFGYNKKEGVLIGTESERYSFRLKSDHQLSNKLTLGENVYFSRTNALGTSTTSSYSGAIINAIYMPAAAPVYDEEGNFHGTVSEDLTEFAGAYGDVYNPVALLLRPTTTNPVNNINANVYLEYDILEGLTFKTNYSYNYQGEKFKRFYPMITEIGRTTLENYLYQSYSDENRWIWDNQLNYKKSFGKHNIDVTAVYSSQKTNYEYFYTQASGFSSEEAYNQYVGNASQIDNYSSTAYEDALTSAVGRAMYNFDNKYYTSLSIRRDESSRLAEQNQADFFPSASLGWRISKEDFFNLDAVNELKIRASWGQIGNINSVGYYSFNVPLYSTTVIIGEDGELDDRGVYIGQQSNPDLKWETSESLDFGIDAEFFNRSFSVTLDYFEKQTKDMILEGLEDLHQGTEAAYVNGGEVKNYGLEVSLGYRKTFGEVGFSARANASFIDNELVNLDGYNQSGINYIDHSTNVRSTLYPYRSTPGEELYSYYLVPYLGIFNSQAEIDAYTNDGELIQPNAVPGDFKFADTNNDGQIDNNDKVYMGSYQPDVTYSFNFNVDYKGFDLGVMFQGVSGAKAFNGYKYTAYNASSQGYNLDSRVLNAWTETNTNIDIPIISTTDNNQNFGTASSWYLEDASYLRLKNVNLGYTFSSDIMNQLIENSSLRVYLSAENVFTITNYSGMDPEVGGIGLDIGKYPLSRTISGGLSFSF